MRRVLKYGAVIMALAFWWGPPKSGASVPLVPLAPGAVPTTTTTAPMAQGQSWETQLLDGIHAPLTATNYQVLTVWAASEGVVDKNNPLASSGRHQGATVCIAQCTRNSSPVYAYDSIVDGVNANINFLYGSYYDGVRAAFRANAGMAGIWKSVNQSKWCSGCQGGLYPIKLYQAIPAPTTTTTLAPSDSPLP